MTSTSPTTSSPTAGTTRPAPAASSVDAYLLAVSGAGSVRRGVPVLRVRHRATRQLHGSDAGPWPSCLGVDEGGHLRLGELRLTDVAAQLGTPFLVADDDDVRAVVLAVQDVALLDQPEQSRQEPGSGRFVTDGRLVAVRLPAARGAGRLVAAAG